jgi:CDP-diacylglycerol---glycerol-3-phosphate 3-phosphatidyltransferase
MNLPNKLTISRLFLTVVFVSLFYVPYENRITLALLIFIIASITDFLDGEIARKQNLVTNFGKLMDPLADKILISAALVILCANFGSLPAWAVIAILAREFFVTGIRQIAADQGAVLAAEKLGKHKMVWQIITVIFYLLMHSSTEPVMRWMGPVFGWQAQLFGGFCIMVTVTLTMVSGFSYFWKNRSIFSDL